LFLPPKDCTVKVTKITAGLEKSDGGSLHCLFPDLDYDG